MLELLKSETNSYEFLTGKSLAMFLFRDDKNVYLLRGTTVSTYMSEQLCQDVVDALELGFTLSEIVDLFDKSDSLELLGTTLETFEKYCVDNWNWHKWSFNHNFQNRFWTYISKGKVYRKVS